MTTRFQFILGSFVAMGLLFSAACAGDTTENQDDQDVLTGDLRVEPSELNFGQVYLDEAWVEPFTIVNESSEPVTIESIRVTSVQFSMLNAPVDGWLLEPGSTRTVDVQFRPMALDAANDLLTIETDHAEVETLAVGLYGFGIEDEVPGDDDDNGDDDDDDDLPEECGIISVDPLSCEFGVVEVGKTASEIITVTNVGAFPLEIHGVQFTGAGYSNVGGAPVTVIDPGHSMEIEAQFAPSADGVATGSVVIDSCDPANPAMTVSLSGTGDEGCGDNCNPDIDVNYSAIDFGTLGGGGAWADFVVSNAGPDPLQLSGIDGTYSLAGGTVSITSGDQYALIQPGDTEYFTMEWTPGELFAGYGCLDGMDGAYNYITIWSDDPDEPVTFIDLYGCCDAAGTGICFMVNFINVMYCIDQSSCADPITGFMHCTLGFPC